MQRTSGLERKALSGSARPAGGPQKYGPGANLSLVNAVWCPGVPRFLLGRTGYLRRIWAVCRHLIAQPLISNVGSGGFDQLGQSRVPMDSLEPECTPLKKTYDSCFNRWFERYLSLSNQSPQTPGRQAGMLRMKQQYEQDCGTQWNAYQACLNVKKMPTSCFPFFALRVKY